MNKTYLLSIFVAVLMIFSCTKNEVIRVTGEKFEKEKEVPAAAGEFMAAVTIADNSKVAWKALPVDNWLHVDDDRWMQNNAVRIRYDSNESTANSPKFARVGHVVIATHDGFVADTIVVKQKGQTLQMAFVNKENVVEASEVECDILFSSNLIDECRPGITLTADESWVEKLELLPSGTQVRAYLVPNSGDERTATITLAFKPAWGEPTKTKCKLTQKALE